MSSDNRARKRATRVRMRQTGERYTTAARNLPPDSAPRDPNWPCPNGCTEPHDPLYAYPRCAVLPSGPFSQERCAGGCLSRERAWQAANPGLFFDLADSASMYCYYCDLPVCVGCQEAPVDGELRICDRCSADAAAIAPVAEDW